MEPDDYKMLNLREHCFTLSLLNFCREGADRRPSRETFLVRDGCIRKQQDQFTAMSAYLPPSLRHERLMLLCVDFRSCFMVFLVEKRKKKEVLQWQLKHEKLNLSFSTSQ